MSTKLSKDDLKNPDIVTQELKKGFQWTTQHSKLVTGLSVGFIVVGLGFSLIQYMNQKNETELQEKYFQFEKDYLKKKTEFEKYEFSLKNAAQFKNDPKAKKEEPPKLEGEKATGDLEKDFGTAAKGFENLISQAPNSAAAQMSALQLADIYVKYGKIDEALTTLKKVKANSSMFGGMVQAQIGSLYAAKKDCSSALTEWGKVIQNSKAKFIHADIQIKMGLCFESTNDQAKAKEMYNKVIAENKDSQLSKTAEKYLRLIK